VDIDKLHYSPLFYDSIKEEVKGTMNFIIDFHLALNGIVKATIQEQFSLGKNKNLLKVYYELNE